jgi:PmbA protein
MMDEHQLLEIGSKAVKNAQKSGADEAEAYIYVENETTVQFVGGIFASRSGAVKGLKGAFVRIAEPWIKKKGLPQIKSGMNTGVGIRSVVDKAIGFSSVSSIEEKQVLEAAEEATKIAKIRPPDPNWVSLPDARKPTGEGGIFDKRISEMDIEKLLDLSTICCVTIGDFDKRIVQAMTMIATITAAFAAVNTNGVEAYDKGTAFTGYFAAKAKAGAEEVSSSEVLVSRSYTEDLLPLATSASKRTIESLGKRPLTQKHSGLVVFENMSWNELFSVIFPSGVSALNVQENRSPFKGKIGAKVAKEFVSIVDDGTLAGGFGTMKFDDEGVPRQQTPLIEKGVLSNVLYDNYTAKRESRESTGNASRQGRASSRYANQPVIRPTNLMLLPGKGMLNELISELKEGVLIKGSLTGALHSNTITGDFSVSADNAFKIENGEIAYPLKPCTVAGNLYDTLNSIVTVGNDSRSFGNTICPSIIVDKIVVST